MPATLTQQVVQVMVAGHFQDLVELTPNGIHSKIDDSICA